MSTMYYSVHRVLGGDVSYLCFSPSSPSRVMFCIIDPKERGMGDADYSTATGERRYLEYLSTKLGAMEPFDLIKLDTEDEVRQMAQSYNVSPSVKGANLA